MKCKAPKADTRRPIAAIAYPERRPRSLMAGSDEGAWAQLRRSVTRDPPRPPPCSFRFYRGNGVRHAFGCPCCDALAPPAPPGAVYTLREGRRIASDPCLGLTRAKDLQRELAEVGIGRVRHEHRIFVRGKRPAPAERSRTRGQSLSDRVALHRGIVDPRWPVARHGCRSQRCSASPPWAIRGIVSFREANGTQEISCNAAPPNHAPL